MANKAMITTTDNPYNPQTDFQQWYLYDVNNGYNTCAYLGRIVKDSEELSDEEKEIENERAIDEIIKYDFMNIYKKIYVN